MRLAFSKFQNLGLMRCCGLELCHAWPTWEIFGLLKFLGWRWRERESGTHPNIKYNYIKNHQNTLHIHVVCGMHAQVRSVRMWAMACLRWTKRVHRDVTQMPMGVFFHGRVIALTLSKRSLLGQISPCLVCGQYRSGWSYSKCCLLKQFNWT